MRFQLKEKRIRDKILKMYIPLKVPKGLTAVDPIQWDLAIIGDVESFEFLEKVFLISAELRENECIYIPTVKSIPLEYREIWKMGIFDLDILIVNRSHTHIKEKVWETMVEGLRYIKGEVIQYLPTKIEVEKVPDFWLTDRRLSATRRGKKFILQTNSITFEKLAYDIRVGMTGFKNEESYNFQKHIHEDWIGTRKDNGFNFLYYFIDEQ